MISTQETKHPPQTTKPHIINTLANTHHKNSVWTSYRPFNPPLISHQTLHGPPPFLPPQLISLLSSFLPLAMAAVSTFLSKPPTSFLPRADLHSAHSIAAVLPLFPRKSWRSLGKKTTLASSPRASAAASGTKSPAASSSKKADERVQKVHSIDEFDAALRSAKNRLVVVEFAASDSTNSQEIYPFMVGLSRTCSDVEFVLVMGDESEQTRELCEREGIDRFPHFTFYKSMEKLHEEEGIGPDQLVGDVLYYGDSHSAVVQLHSRADVEAVIEEHRGEGGKLVVLDVGLKHCGPCVKVYPTVIKLSRSMADAVVFARMNGDENDSCMEFLRDMDVVEVPTFLFIKDGEIRGRYVGSGKGELIGEILRYQGVFK